MKRSKALTIGLIAGGAFILGAASVVFWSSQVFSGGSKVAGVDVSYLSPADAATKIKSTLESETLIFSTASFDGVVQASQLPLKTSYEEELNKLLPEHNLLLHGFSSPGELLTVDDYDETGIHEAVFAANTESQSLPVDANIHYENGSFVVTGGSNGLLASSQELLIGFLNGERLVTVEEIVPEPALKAETATATATALNNAASQLGFYGGDERLVEITPDELASWVKIVPDPAAGAFSLEFDDTLIEERVNALPAAVNRPVVSGEEIVNSRGEVLWTISPSSVGYELLSTEGLIEATRGAIADGSGKIAIEVERSDPAPLKRFREIEVDLGNQVMHMRENGELVESLAISSGKAATPTPTGRFAVFAHVPIQNMGCGPNSSYCTEDVPWVVYFAPDIAFHGAYWHNNFGNVMSHGCVNLPVEQAKRVYQWTYQGTEVWVHG